LLSVVFIKLHISVWTATIGDPAFPVAASLLWNTGADVTLALSLTVFRKRPNTHLLNLSFLQSHVVPEQ